MIIKDEWFFFSFMAMKACPEEMLQKYVEFKEKHPLPKPDKDSTRKENHRSMSLINRYKNPPQILASWIQQHVNHTMTQWDLPQKHKVGSTYENPSMNNTILIE